LFIWCLAPQNRLSSRLINKEQTAIPIQDDEEKLVQNKSMIKKVQEPPWLATKATEMRSRMIGASRRRPQEGHDALRCITPLGHQNDDFPFIYYDKLYLDDGAPWALMVFFSHS
jgi:hypothetical protein